MNTSDAYRQTLDYLYTRLPMFSRIGGAAIKKDLTNTLLLCEALGQPQAKFKSVHIAGTNGKGSTSHMLAALFRESGFKTGLYTSPHLVDFRERIRIDGQPVAEQFVVDFVERYRPDIERIEPSFFEITVAMAFAAFAEAEADIAIIETGLGGRLDSTNVITPELSVITNISMDHMDLLGDTLAAIAGEKAGIIKPGVPVLIGERQPETERVFLEAALKAGSPIYYAESSWELVRTGRQKREQYYKAVHQGRRQLFDIHTDLLGAYQQHNIKTVLAAAEVLAAYGWKVSIENAIRGLRRVKELTGLRGRWDRLQERPAIIADVAHNPAGLKEVLEQWQREPAAGKHVVLGFVKDKDVATALTLFPKDNTYYCTAAALPRALPAGELQAMATAAGLAATAYDSVPEALQAARAAMSEGDALLITGSFFIVGEAMTALSES